MSLKDLLKYPFKKRRWKAGIGDPKDAPPIEELIKRSIANPPKSEPLELISYAEFERRIKEAEKKK